MIAVFAIFCAVPSVGRRLAAAFDRITEGYMMFSDTTTSQTHAGASVLASVATPPSHLRALFSRQPIERIERDSTILWEGDAAPYVFEIVEGVLRIVRMVSGGRRVITRFVYAGDVLGAAFGDPYGFSIEAVTPIKLRRLARCHFKAAVAGLPQLAPAILAQLCAEVAAAQEQIVLLSRKTAEERVSSFLLLVARWTVCDHHALPVVEIPMCRSDIADYLGLTKETVSRAMAVLIQRGMIARGGRQRIVIRAVDRLASHCGDNDEDNHDPVRPRLRTELMMPAQVPATSHGSHGLRLRPSMTAP